MHASFTTFSPHNDTPHQSTWKRKLSLLHPTNKLLHFVYNTQDFVFPYIWKIEISTAAPRRAKVIDLNESINNLTRTGKMICSLLHVPRLDHRSHVQSSRGCLKVKLNLVRFTHHFLETFAGNNATGLRVARLRWKSPFCLPLNRRQLVGSTINHNFYLLLH